MPVAIHPGDKIAQSVTLRLEGHSRPVLPVIHGRAPQISISTTPLLALPPIGLCAARDGKPLSARETARLKALKLSHLRVELDLASPDYPDLLETASHDAQQLETALHVALAIGDDPIAELRGLKDHLARIKPNVALWLLTASTVPTEKSVRLAQAALKDFAPNVLIAAGTRQFFADLNQARPGPDYPAYLCYSINPQVHQTDLRTLVENLAAQPFTVEAAREFSSKPVVISPITLKSPFNPEMTLPSSTGALPADADPRQMSLFCAGWTLGSIARLAATAHVHSLSYYETTGWYGVLERDEGSPLPDKFPSAAGMVFPVYHLFADIAEFPARQLYPTHSSHPLSVEALTLCGGRARKRVLVASYSPQPLELKIKTGTCTAVVRYLDETNAAMAMQRPEEFRALPGTSVQSVSGKIELRLLPFALARVDLE